MTCASSSPPQPLVLPGVDVVAVQMALDDWLDQWPYYEGAGVHLTEAQWFERETMRDLRRRLHEQCELALEAPLIVKLLDWWFENRSDFSFVSDSDRAQMEQIRRRVIDSLPESARYAAEILGSDFSTGPLL